MRHDVRNALPFVRSPSNSDGVEGFRESFFQPAAPVATNFNDKNRALPNKPMCIMPRAGKIDISLNLPRGFH